MTGEPMGKDFSARLKTLSRMRVATVSCSSDGALTIENAWRMFGSSAAAVSRNDCLQL